MRSFMFVKHGAQGQSILKVVQVNTSNSFTNSNDTSITFFF